MSITANGPTATASLGEEPLLTATVLGDRHRRRIGRHQVTSGEGVSVDAGGFSNSVVTTAHSSPRLQHCSRIVVGGDDVLVGDRTAAGADGDGSTTIVRYPITRAATKRVATELTAAEHADRRWRDDRRSRRGQLRCDRRVVA